MLKTVQRSSAKKTAGCAVTYRAGGSEKFSTCPVSCKLNPTGTGCSPNQIDLEYLDALLDAKPRFGFSFTYSHFETLFWAHKLRPEKTTINYSADSLAEAYAIFANNIAPVVTVVKPNFWKNGKHSTVDRDDMPTPPVRIVRCPAEYNPAVPSCTDCGGKDGPLCARLNRDFIIGFTAHGASKKKAATDDPGGCYAAGGNVALHWNATAQQEQEQTDGEKLRAFVKTLSPRAIIRHHVAGDIGQDNI